MSSLTDEQVLKIQIVEYKRWPDESIHAAQALANILEIFTKQRTTIEAQAQRIATLEALRVKYGPICLNCGKAEPCMTEAEANQHGGSIPCTFDPAPRELWDRCKQQAQRIRELEGAIIGLETLLKETRTLHDEYAMAAMTGLLANPSSWNEGDPKVITWARNAADEALRQRKGEP